MTNLTTSTKLFASTNHALNVEYHEQADNHTAP